MVHGVEMGFWEQKRRRRRAALQSRPWQQHSFLVDGATGALTHVRGTGVSITDASHRTLRYAHAIDWDVTEEVRDAQGHTEDGAAFKCRLVCTLH